MGLAGRPILPADKSIAHRVALFASLADGESEIVGFSDAADPQSTLACLRTLRVEWEAREDSLIVAGQGLRGWLAPSGPLDCGNSGTTMRLLMGALAGQPFDTTLVGDASLSVRPMARVADPLRKMGAEIALTDGHAPVYVSGRSIHGVTYELPVASAQVKSALLLAGLFAAGETTVIEPVPTRDHTERLLGLDVFEIGGARHITVSGGHQVPAGLWVVPRDFSAAAFFLVAGCVVSHSAMELKAVGLNPTRCALLDVLRAMGANITLRNERFRQGEPIGDLWIQNDGGRLQGIEVGGDLIPNIIDEIPVLAVAACYAEGRTVIRDAAELRVKETDRIAATAEFLRAMGARVVEQPDGMVIDGGHPLQGAEVDSYGDHRIAMAAAVAALGAAGETVIRDPDAVAVSFPGFWDELADVSGTREVLSDDR
jgi:3-phosphoshikimate 1-carboxyvinyltransferase